jgi:hypothetical protein
LVFAYIFDTFVIWSLATSNFFLNSSLERSLLLTEKLNAVTDALHQSSASARNAKSERRLFHSKNGRESLDSMKHAILKTSIAFLNCRSLIDLQKSYFQTYYLR